MVLFAINMIAPTICGAKNVWRTIAMELWGNQFRLDLKLKQRSVTPVVEQINNSVDINIRSNHESQVVSRVRFETHNRRER